MAGRPKMMAKRVTELEAQGLELSRRVFEFCPKKSMKGDPICEAWDAVVGTTMNASIELQQLGDLLREKAGITEPGPVQQFDEEILAMQSESAAGKPPAAESPPTLVTPAAE